MGRSLAHSPTAAIRLELSGPRLTGALARLAAESEASGGIEQYVQALKMKGALFRELLGQDGADAAALEPEALRILVPFMPTVRRRIGPWLARPAFDALREEVVRLVRALRDNSRVDEQLCEFGGLFCKGERPRWTRDFGAELLHQLSPERFPLMTRWVWDAAANTGVLREIWFGGQEGSERIDVPDSYPVFLTLREELSGFLTGNGVFRDVIYYVDLLCAQVYAEYICAQGGTYLRVDFSAEEDPSQYTRRLLGLDGIKGDAHARRPRSIEGAATEAASCARRLPD
jgi:hypothetical protein